MASPVFGSSGLQAAAFQAIKAPATVSKVSLEAIRFARGNINEIRMLLKGDIKACHTLFKQAVEEGDTVSQIQLSHAHFGIKWGKDDTKDFSSLVVGDLETFSYYPNEFAIFTRVYSQAMGVEFDYITRQTKATETFRSAASRGYLPAFLELVHTEWKHHASS